MSINLNGFDLDDFIPVGKTNSISMTELSITLGSDPREVRALVNKARKNGIPICSDCRGGYYLPESPNEAKIYFRQQTARINSAKAALNGVKNYLQQHRKEEE